MKKKIEIKRFDRDENSQYLVMKIEDGRLYVLINGDGVMDDNSECMICIPPKVRTAKINGSNEIYFRDKQKQPVTYHSFYERIHKMSKYVKSFDVSLEQLKVYEKMSKYYE